MRTLSWLSTLALALVGWGLRDAVACGGFFCDGQQIDQVGERVLFTVDSVAGTVEAQIQIRYSGEAADFSWVVPISANPEIDVGSDEVFTRLAAATDPAYRIALTTVNCDLCPVDPLAGFGERASEAPEADGDADADGGEVEIVRSGVVGPYETVVLSSDDPGALTTWLNANGYDIPPTAEPMIDAYVAAGDYFVGLKLARNADTGDLRPVIFRSSQTEPCIPLRLTAIAASADMPVFAWFLGDGRFVSTNYLEVRPNDALFYAAVLSYTETARRAIDEAGGRAFVTELAADASDYADTLSPEGYDADVFRRLDSPVDVMAEIVRQGFSASQLLLGLLEVYLPPPAGIDSVSFYNDPGAYADESYTFDPDALAEAIEQTFVAPLAHVRDAMLRSSKLTRLFTVISPAEMTMDPEFAIADLPDVPREHVGSALRDCRDTESVADDYMEITTPAGHRFAGGNLEWDGSWWTETEGYVDGGIVGYLPGEMPAAESIIRHEVTPGPVPRFYEIEVRDATLAIDAALSTDAAKTPPDLGSGYCGDEYDPPDPPAEGSERASGCACETGGKQPPEAAAAIALVLVALCARRRHDSGHGRSH